MAAVDVKESIRLNRRFRNKSAPASVLSFAVPSGYPGGEIGEVVICPAVVRRKHRPYSRGLSELTVHGVLHLLGFHHSDRAAGEQMFALQRAIVRERR